MKRSIFSLIFLLFFFTLLFSAPPVPEENILNNVVITSTPIEDSIGIDNKSYIISPNIKIFEKSGREIPLKNLNKGDNVDIKYHTGAYSELFPYKKGEKVVFYIKRNLLFSSITGSKGEVKSSPRRR